MLEFLMKSWPASFRKRHHHYLEIAIYEYFIRSMERIVSPIPALPSINIITTVRTQIVVKSVLQVTAHRDPFVGRSPRLCVKVVRNNPGEVSAEDFVPSQKTWES
ncbi:hypothetical protein EYF80_020761 [Liparis tanakae]|uniref:Uncharacterized protein n=1 Tax=Liparis tanakae TaxID=230148 RepID=A0A4Z2HTH0_9TELE|nr:hypothetical protein EYF80_020761 [Liparis tanakae]